MATDMTIPEEKNMEALAESWDFLERELENFQRICAELEKGERQCSQKIARSAGVTVLRATVQRA